MQNIASQLPLAALIWWAKKRNFLCINTVNKPKVVNLTVTNITYIKQWLCFKHKAWMKCTNGYLEIFVTKVKSCSSNTFPRFWGPQSGPGRLVSI